MLYKIRLIPVSMTDLEYSKFLKLARLSGSQHSLFTHLILTGYRYSLFVKRLESRPKTINICKVA